MNKCLQIEISIVLFVCGKDFFIILARILHQLLTDINLLKDSWSMLLAEAKIIASNLSIHSELKEIHSLRENDIITRLQAQNTFLK